jgi:hypothetical protein
MEKRSIMIHLLLLIALSVSCVENKSTTKNLTQSASAEQVPTPITDTLRACLEFFQTENQ